MAWKTVYKSENLQRAEIIKTILEEKDLHPVLLNKKDSSYLFGMFEIQVSVDEVLSAIREIEKINFE